MPRNFIKYELGRLNILPHVDDSRKRSFLVQGLEAGMADEYRGNYWSFVDIGVEEVDDTSYIVGYLVKYEQEGSEEVVDEGRHRIAIEKIKNAIRAKARFAIHLPSMIIAFHPVSPEIKRSTFISRFVHLLQAGHSNFFVQADIQLILDERFVLDVLRRFSIVTRLSITLHPSNPSNRALWQKYDNRLRELNAAEYTEQYKSAPVSSGDPGIKAVDDEEIKGKIVMAEDGYGEASVTGILDGEPRTISTRRSTPISVVAPRDEISSSKDVARTINSVVQKVLERFR